MGHSATPFVHILMGVDVSFVDDERVLGLLLGMAQKFIQDSCHLPFPKVQPCLDSIASASSGARSPSRSKGTGVSARSAVRSFQPRV